MIVYHGTCSKFGEKIVAENCFCSSTPSNYIGNVKIGDSVINVETSRGYVFFTNDFSVALHYGSITCLSERDNTIQIFCINISDDVLTKDIDLERIGDIQNPEVLSLCVNGSVELDKYDCDLISVPSHLDVENKCFYFDVVKVLLMLSTCEMKDKLNDYQNNIKAETLENLFKTKQWTKLQ